MLRALLARWQTEDKATKMAAERGPRVCDPDRPVWATVDAVHARIHRVLCLRRRIAGDGGGGRPLADGRLSRTIAMITDFRTLDHGSTVREAANMLLATSQQDFPVVLGEQVMGLLGRNALLRGMAVDGPDAYVAGIMDREFPRVSPQTALVEAIPLLGRCPACW